MHENEFENVVCKQQYGRFDWAPMMHVTLGS